MTTAAVMLLLCTNTLPLSCSNDVGYGQLADGCKL